MDLEVDKWLRDLGMGQYADAFSQNDVDGRVLHLLTNDDLKELGVSLGHRKLILSTLQTQAATADGDGTGGIAQEMAAQDVAPNKKPAPSAAAERRHLTVMFADLVGSTELTNRYDPEDMRVLLQRYQDAVAGAVSRYGGYVAKYLGDGLLVFFGWPRAYEDHAMRAIKAGLDVVQSVSAQHTPDGTPLSVRVGIASGEVVVGDTIGENTYEEGAMTGPILNLAARIQEHAPPNTIVMPEEGTEASLWRIFEFASLGQVSLKGFDAPCALLQVQAERTAESRFRATHTQDPANILVGRNLEKGILKQAWQHAKNGKGEVVLLTGQAGIGKSRLTEEFLSDTSVAGEADVIRLNCSPYMASSPFHPVSERISQDAEVEPDFDDDQIVERVREMLSVRQGVEMEQVLPVFAALVAPRATVAKEVLALSPQEQRDITIRTLIDTVKTRASLRPVILFVEDAHWIDPSTNALVDRFKDICADLPLMLLVTHRPEWTLDQSEGDAHVQTLQLRRFDADRVADLVQNVSGQEPDWELVEMILEKTDGVPLFVEEMTRAITASADQGNIKVPSSLKGMLMSRLDAVTQEAKQVALTGAVIGREFEPALLREAMQDSPVDTNACLEELRKSGLIFESGHGRGNYVFRHALIRDTAYQSMLAATRKEQHASVARALVKLRAAEIDRQPELVARHLTEAEDWAPAFARWRSATDMALARSASREAVTNAQEALDAAQHLGDEACVEVITSKILVGRSYDSVGRLPESLSILEQAWKAARQIGDAHLAAEAADRFADAAAMAGEDPGVAIELCLRSLEALLPDDGVRRCALYSQLARAYIFMGQVDKSREYGQKTMELAARFGDYKAQHSVMMSRYGAPYISRTADEAGNWRQHLAKMREVAQKLGKIEQGRDRTLSLFVGAEMADRDLMDQSLDLLIEISEKDNHRQLYWVQRHARAMLAILNGDFEQAEVFANEAVKIGRQTHGAHVEGVYGVQMFTIRREQSRLSEVAPVIKRLMTDSPEDISWKPGFGLIAAELGYRDAALRILDELAETGFMLPHDAIYSTTLSYLADICVAVEHLEHAQTIYDLLSPYEALTITAGATTVCLGSGARRLGSLAALMGDWETSHKMFETAIDVDSRMKSPPWIAHSKAAFAAALRKRGRKQDFKRALQLEADALATAQNLGMVSLRSKFDRECI